MRYLVKKVDYKKKLFITDLGGQEAAILLSTKNAKIFLPLLSVGSVVEFTVLPKRKKIHGRLCYNLNYFIFIASTNPYSVVYDLHKLRTQMVKLLGSFKHFLFLDCEMTMPGYSPQYFYPQVIQVGYILTDANGQNIASKDYYVTPLQASDFNRRTQKFLNLTPDVFFKAARSYKFFYQDLKTLVEKYQPKIVVWGKNDILALLNDFKRRNKVPFLAETDFIDLLQLHKDFFCIRNDVGLFKAHQAYYGKIEEKQQHDAKTDAVMTKEIFFGFSDSIKKLIN